MTTKDDLETTTGDATKSHDEVVTTKESWVQCDSCNKWRRIPAVLADKLDDNVPWHCQDNPNAAFASCSIRQELTNEEIDKEQEEEEERRNQARGRMPVVVQVLRDNVFAHRKRKIQDEDDIMICQCKPVWRGGDGCGPDCINRMLAIECMPGYCPCEDHCTNQVFSKKQFAKLDVKRAGAKGHGLFAAQPIRAGQFIIEYVGEVLEEDEYLRRKDFYQEVGQRHYYFMNIGNGEVIDACRKGNNARFINHSCDPNCETQKWLVKGELAIGLFALKDMAEGEELTFDYNFERYGDKPIRCHCETKACRKFIGGSPDQWDESAMQEDPDASKDLPPVMVAEQDLDQNVKAILDWRVGVEISKDKQSIVLARLTKLCMSQSVPWTTDQVAEEDLDQLLGGAIAELEDYDEPISSDEDEDEDEQRPASKKSAAAKAAKKMPAGGKKSGGANAATVSKLRSSSQKQKSSSATISNSSSATTVRDAAVDSVAPRGPLKAAFKQWKAKQVDPGVIVDDDISTLLAAAKDTPARRRKTTSGPSATRSSVNLDSLPQLDVGAKKAAGAGRKAAALQAASAAAREGSGPKAGAGGSAMAKRRSEIDRRLDSLIGQTGRLKDPSRANIVKVLRMFNLCDIAPTVMKPIDPEPFSTLMEPPKQDSIKSEPNGTASVGAAALSEVATGTSDAPPYGNGSSALNLKQEPKTEERVDPDLDPLSGSAAALHRPDPEAPAADGDGGPRSPPHDGGIKSPPREEYPTGGAHLVPGVAATVTTLGGGGGHPNGPGGFTQAPPPTLQVTGKQRARMADLSLLLDIVLKTNSQTIKKEFVVCGILNQLHQAIGRNLSREYSMILRKILRVVEALPLTADDIYSVRSAHGTFADMMQELSLNIDFDVRSKASALIKKFPLSACTDPYLIQQHNSAGGHRQQGGKSGGGMPLYMRMGFSDKQGGTPPSSRPSAGSGELLAPEPNRPGRLLRPTSARDVPSPTPAVEPPPSSTTPPLPQDGTVALPGPPPGGSRLQRSSNGNLFEAGGSTDHETGGASGFPPPPGSAGLKDRSGNRVGAPMRPLYAQRPVTPMGLPPLPPVNGGPSSATPMDVDHPSTTAADRADDQGGLKRRRSFNQDDGGGGGREGGSRWDSGSGQLHQYGGGPGGMRVGGSGSYQQAGIRPLPEQLPRRLTAEHLFERLRPERAGDGGPLPPLEGADTGPHWPHGEPTSIEVACALGLAHGWEAVRAALSAQSAAEASALEAQQPQRRSLGLRLPPKRIRDGAAAAGSGADAAGPPMSPLSHPESYSPQRPEWADAAPGASGLGPAGGGGGGSFARRNSFGEVGTAPSQPSGPMVMDLKAATAARALGGPYGGGGTPDPASRTGSGPLLRPIGTPLPYGGGASGSLHDLPPGMGRSPSFSRPMPPPLSSYPGASGDRGGGEPPMLSNGVMPRVSSLSGYGSGPNSGAGTPVHSGQGGGGFLSSPPYQQRGAEAAGMQPKAAPPPSSGIWEGWTRTVSSNHPETWEAPDENFERFVTETVQSRIGKYVQHDHPNPISEEDAHALSRKIQREVMDKERKAYADRQAQNLPRPMERRKLEGNIKEFVKQSIRRLHSAQQR